MADHTYRVLMTKVAEVFTVAASPEEAKKQAEDYAKRVAVPKRTTHVQMKSRPAIRCRCPDATG